MFVHDKAEHHEMTGQDFSNNIHHSSAPLYERIRSPRYEALVRQLYRVGSENTQYYYILNTKYKTLNVYAKYID